jgi:hypothetical protein
MFLDKIDANIKIQKLSNVFFNVQQMFHQLVDYLFFSIPTTRNLVICNESLCN